MQSFSAGFLIVDGCDHFFPKGEFFSQLFRAHLRGRRGSCGPLLSAITVTIQREPRLSFRRAGWLWAGGAKVPEARLPGCQVSGPSETVVPFDGSMR